MKVKCISDYEKLLTVGREYNVLGFPNDNEIRVKNDRGTVVNLPKALFDTSQITITQVKNEVINVVEEEKKVRKGKKVEIEIETQSIEQEEQENIMKTEVEVSEGLDTDFVEEEDTGL